MKFRYSESKNAKLQKERGIGFEEIIEAIQNGNVFQTEHPNPAKYPNQKIAHVELKGTIYVVPYVSEPDGTFFLKTLYPSRKAAKKYTKAHTSYFINFFAL
ncbi:MAG: DUF4258 domain-containing protein [Proteobacteria bacterium]|nr:DUF4258 domain-containing protein [Pseudomonadota bacterium]